MTQLILPLFSEETTSITNLVCYAKRDGQIYYFLGQLPMYSHAEDDINSFRFITSQLVVNGHVKQMDIVRAFGVTKISVKRSVKKFHDEGLAGFSTKKQRTRKAHILTPERLEKVQRYLDNDYELKEICKELDMKLSTLRQAIQKGKLQKKK